MPVKNAAPFLAQTLASLKAQSYTNWELIAIDDHSQDSSQTILDNASQKDPRVKVFKNKGAGIIPALEQARQAAQGTYLGRLDADDLFPPQRLKIMVSALSRSKKRTVVTGQVRYFGEPEISPGYRKYEKWLNANLTDANPWKQVYRECVVASPNWLMRSRELEEMGGFKDLQYPEDYDLVFKWYAAGYALHSLPEVTLLWREHPLRTSRQSEHYQQKAFFTLKLQRFLEIESPTHNLVLWGEGAKARLSAKFFKDKGQPFHWLSLSPKKATPQRQALEHYSILETYPKPKVLVAVYPPKAHRLKMENYFRNLGLVEGQDWWYL